MSSAPLFCARPSQETIKTVIAALTERFGERAVTGEAVREQHGHTRSYLETQASPKIVAVMEKMFSNLRTRSK